MNVLAGVDEAGLGPILGPLVVAGAAMAGPPNTNPWRALRDRVCRHRNVNGRIRVADSKKVHQGPSGFARLEHTVLSFYGAWRGALPADLPALLTGLAIDPTPFTKCPWYGDLALPLPVAVDRSLLELRIDGLCRSLRREQLEILHLAALPIDAEQWNGLIAQTDNKSRAHFHAYARVIAAVAGAIPPGSHLVADRCGGLVHYVPALRRAYPRARIRTLAEQDHESRYAITSGERDVVVSFAAGGEDRAFPTALASCLAKYLRELMLRLLNRWFAARVTGLRPTAGYFTDGHRFLTDIAALLDSGEVPRDLLVRVR